MPELSTVQPSSQLCTHCQSSKWPQVPARDPPDIYGSPLHETFLLLQESADRGCTLCRFVWSYVVNRHSITKETVGLLAKGSLGQSVLGARPDGMGMYLHIKDSSTSLNEFRGIDFDKIEGDSIDRYNYSKARQIKGTIWNSTCFEEDTMIDDLKYLIKDQIQPWIKSCLEQQGNHSNCGPANDFTVLPTRLVDVGTSQHPLVRLVETNQRKSTHATRHYLILSYCWGQGNTSAKTTSDNLTKRLREISTDELPKTIQDAILVTRMMGFQYIWIDAMCIIQATDENDPGDFASEALKMGDYYANADCCISASLASDSAQGFLTQRPLARFPIQQDIILKLPGPSSTSSHSVMIRASQRHYSLKEVLMDTPLMKRGWYLQELMLSRRILHWTFHGLYLQCQSSTLLEGSLEAWPDFSSDIDIDPREVLALPYDKILAYDGWCQLLGYFSKKALTFESDRMYAIHGIACVLVQRFGAEYFYGLFRQHLAQGLAWARDDGPDYDVFFDRPSKPRRRTAYPTWCWASDCPVSFYPIDEKHIFVHDNHTRRPRLFPTHPGNMTLRPALDSRLYIKAPLIHVKIDHHIACITHDHNDRRIEEFYKCVLDTQRDEIGGSFASPLYDPEATALEKGVDVQWLLLGVDRPVGRTYLGLLVFEIEGQETRVYRRYGRLMIQWRTQTSIRDFYDEPEEITLE